MLLPMLMMLAANPAASDPLAPAREGKIMCVVPNVEKKTCIGITRYRVATTDRYETTTSLFLAPSPLITMDVRTEGTVKGEEMCETVKLASFQAGTVFLNGQPADEATSGAVKSQMAAALGALDGKRACSVFVPAEDGMILNQATIDGAPRADLSQKFIWVSEGDGYTLGM